MRIRVSQQYANKVHRSMFETFKCQQASGMLVPVIVSLASREYDATLDSVKKMGLTVGQSIPRFGMFSSLVRPEDIQLLAAKNEIAFIDPDIPKYAMFRVPLPPAPPLPPLPFLPQFPVVQSVGEAVSANTKSGYIPTSMSRAFIGADEAEKEGFDGSGIKIGVLDTGIFQMHPQINMKADDLNAMLPSVPKSPFPFIPEIPELGFGYDDNGHGTHVITTIAGNDVKSPMGLQCKGVAPRASIVSVKVLGTPLGMGMTSDVLKGIDLAIERGCKIISMSLGSEGGDNTYPEARIVNKHPEIIWCIAAGNSGPDAGTIGTPGCATEALTVGSIGILDKQVSHFSSRGPTSDGVIKPDVIAPGGGRKVAPDKTKGEIEEYIYSGTSLGSILDGIEDKLIDAFTPIMGTSMATPHVSGLVALALQAGHIKTRADIIRKMAAASGGAKDNNMGYGLITWKKLKANL